jgi:hypothetical protein
METVATRCENCGHLLQGRYCAACSQKHLTAHDWSFGHLFHEAFHELFHLDGKIVRTLRLLLFRPGALSQEYLQGQRIQQIHPIRLFLTVTAVFFLLGNWTDFNASGLERISGGAGLLRALERIAQRTGTDIETLIPSFNLALHRLYSVALGGAVLGLAFLLHRLQRQRYPHYAQHAIVALHLISSYVITVALWRVLVHFALRAEQSIALLPAFFLLFAPIVWLTIRRVYQPSRGRAVAYTVLLLLALFGLNFLANAVSIAGAMLLSLRSH